MSLPFHTEKDRTRLRRAQDERDQPGQNWRCTNCRKKIVVRRYNRRRRFCTKLCCANWHSTQRYKLRVEVRDGRKLEADRRCKLCGGSIPIKRQVSQTLYCSGRCRARACKGLGPPPSCRVCGKKVPGCRRAYCSAVCQREGKKAQRQVRRIHGSGNQKARA